MKFLVQQNTFNFRLFRKKINVLDEEENLVYLIKANSFFVDFTIYDPTGEIALARMKKRHFRLYSRNDLIIDKQKVATIKRRAGVFKKKFTIKSKINETLNKLKVTGDALGLEVEIHDGENVYAKINKKLIKLRDHYQVEVFDEENLIPFLTLCIVADELIHRRKRNRRNRLFINK